MLIAGWMGELLNVQGVFSHGKFEKGQQVYMEVPQGIEKYYPKNVVLHSRHCME